MPHACGLCTFLCFRVGFLSQPKAMQLDESAFRKWRPGVQVYECLVMGPASLAGAARVLLQARRDDEIKLETSG